MKLIEEELFEEIDTLIDDLIALKDVIVLETGMLQRAELGDLKLIGQEKEKLVPSLQRAHSILKTLVIHDTRQKYWDEEERARSYHDPRIQELTMVMKDLQESLVENEQAVLSAMRATNFVIRTIANALRVDRNFHARYTKEGLPVYGETSEGKNLASQNL